MNFSIRTKIFFSFSLIIFIGIVAIFFNFYLLNFLLQRTNHIFNVIDPAITAAQDLRQSFNVDIRGIEQYGNGYISTSEEAEKIIQPSEAKIEEDIIVIEKSKLVPQSYIDSLKEILVKDEAADEKVFEIKNKTKQNLKMQIITPEVNQAIDNFDIVSNDVNQEIEKIINIIEQHRKDYLKAFIDQVNNDQRYIIAAFSFSILASFLIAYIISRTLSASIVKVKDVALEMSQGDLSQRVEIKSRDEVGKLASAFNQMASSIEKSQEDLRDKNMALGEQSVRLTTQLEKLQKFQKVTIDRELRMVDLKEKLKVCEREHGKKV